MTLQEALHKAQTESALHNCCQHVNRQLIRFEHEHFTPYYVSDWYDSDNTVATYSFGKEL